MPELARTPGTRKAAGGLGREPRLPAALICELRVASGTWRPASVVNISRTGFRVAWLPQCAVGKQIWVRLPGLEAVPATVRWRDHRGVGCEFARPLHEAIIAHMARACH